MKKSNKQSAAMLGAAHFFVDFTCTALLTSAAGDLPYWHVMVCAVLYNGLAFAFQLPLGALADKMKWKRGPAVLGCLLAASGALIPGGIGMCLVIGLGNALFHVGGGIETLQRSRGRSGPVGRFVAPGAVGIFLGPRLSNLTWLVRGALPVCLTVLAVLLWCRDRKWESGQLAAAPLGFGKLAAFCGCMFLTVLLRSYMGTVINLPFLSAPVIALLYTLCIFGGKYFGGVLADRFGVLRSAAVTQVLGTVLLTLSPAAPVLVLPGIFLFNTTMAVTAAGLYRCLPRFPGTMFGLTTFALYLGVLPRLLGLRGLPCNGWSLGVLSLLSAALLVGGLSLMRGGPAIAGGDFACADKVPGVDAGG